MWTIYLGKWRADDVLISGTSWFKQMLVDYYVSNDATELAYWVAENCLQGTTKIQNMNLFNKE